LNFISLFFCSWGCGTRLLHVALLLKLEWSEEGLQRTCAAFLACGIQFSASCPSDFVEEEKANLLKGFLG
jgi:hypothetical protein